MGRTVVDPATVISVLEDDDVHPQRESTPTREAVRRRHTA
jgi:hypothetical protein